MIKDHKISANVVSAGQNSDTEILRTQKDKEAARVLSAEPRGDELAMAVAMMHATLESTTDAILVTDEGN